MEQPALKSARLDFDALKREGAAFLPCFLAPKQVQEFHDVVGRAVCPPGWTGSTDAAVIEIFRSRKGLRDSLYNILQNLAVLHEFSVDIHRWLRHSGFYDWAGFIAPAVWPGLRIDIPDEADFLLPLHQDYASTRSHRAWRTWIPLSPATASTGSIRYMSGTHLLGPLAHDAGGQRYPTIRAELLADRVETVVEAAPGDALFFHPLLVHGSVPNRSAQIKWTMLLQIQDAASPVDPDNPSDPLAAFLKVHETRAKARGSVQRQEGGQTVSSTETAS